MIFDFLLDEVYLAEPSGSEKGIRSSKKIEKGLKAEVKKTPRLGLILYINGRLQVAILFFLF